MNATRNEAREQEILAKLRARPRLEGQHVTETIYCGVKSWGFARLSAIAEIPPTPFEDSALLRMLMGTALGNVLEEGYVSQIQTISPDTNDVGTIDVFLRDHPCEIKVTYLSMRKDITQQEHWLEQLGEYVYRATDRNRRIPFGEFWIVHLLGDHGRKRCLEHGVPIYAEGVKPLKEKHPDTGAARMICPECLEFLEDGDRDTCIRCHTITWTWDELAVLHEEHKWRQEQLQEDILNLDYQPGNPPPIRWGYEFECKQCPVKERIGCAGMEPAVAGDLEADLLASIQNLQEAKV